MFLDVGKALLALIPAIADNLAIMKLVLLTSQL